MRIPNRLKRLSAVIMALTFIIFAIAFMRLSYIIASPALSFTAETNQPAYHLRQNVTVSGNFMDDGEPVSEALVSLDVRNPNDQYSLFRTIPIGNPDERWDIEITEVSVLNENGEPTDKVKIDSVMQLFVTIHNTLANHRSGVVTATVCDGNLIPIGTRAAPFSLSGGATLSRQWTLYVSEWAYDGKATAYYNVYSDYPKDHGVAYAPEETIEFYITRNLELDPPYPSPKSSYTTSPGQYNTYFTVPPDQYTLPGNYNIYVTGRLSPLLKSQASTTFEVQSFPSPPQSAFTYSPLKPYQNMSVTFDASSSSAEGYNDTITGYEWYFNDWNNPEYLYSKIVQHTFEYDGTYTVSLNVTDSEGLWSFTSKPVTVLPEFGPTANFTWFPETSIMNENVTFDASTSTTGWCAKTQRFSPITSYAWNFSDGTGIFTEATATINHNFTQPGNYTVELTVTDADDRSDVIWNTVEVLNMTIKDYDLNGDGIIDMKDIRMVAKAFGAIHITDPLDPKYCEYWHDPPCSSCPHPPQTDINNDGKIDMKDIRPVAKNFGKDP